MHLDPEPRAEVPEQVDLLTCDIEPIHTPGPIQRFGMLVAVDRDCRIRRVSANLSEFLPITPGQVIGRLPEDLVGEDVGVLCRVHRLGKAMGGSVESSAVLDADLPGAWVPFTLALTNAQPGLIIEYEPKTHGLSEYRGALRSISPIHVEYLRNIGRAGNAHDVNDRGGASDSPGASERYARTRGRGRACGPDRGHSGQDAGGGSQRRRDCCQQTDPPLDEPVRIGRHAHPPDASVGICCYPAMREHPALLLHLADTAMYRARKRGCYPTFAERLKPGWPRGWTADAGAPVVANPVVASATGRISSAHGMRARP